MSSLSSDVLIGLNVAFNVKLRKLSHATVVAGNPSLLFGVSLFVGVHHRFFPFSTSLSSLPPPPSFARGMFTNKGGVYSRLLTVQRFVPFHLVSSSPAPSHTASLFSFISFLSSQAWYNEVWLVGCPSSLGSSFMDFIGNHTPFVCLVFFIVHSSLLHAHMLSQSPFHGQDGGASCPGRMKATRMPPIGRRVCKLLAACIPQSHTVR